MSMLMTSKTFDYDTEYLEGPNEMFLNGLYETLKDEVA